MVLHIVCVLRICAALPWYMERRGAAKSLLQHKQLCIRSANCFFTAHWYSRHKLNSQATFLIKVCISRIKLADSIKLACRKKLCIPIVEPEHAFLGGKIPETQAFFFILLCCHTYANRFIFPEPLDLRLPYWASQKWRQRHVWREKCRKAEAARNSRLSALALGAFERKMSRSGCCAANNGAQTRVPRIGGNAHTHKYTHQWSWRLHFEQPQFCLRLCCAVNAGQMALANRDPRCGFCSCNNESN